MQAYVTGKRSVVSGPARPDAWPGRLDVAAISNVRAASRVDSIRNKFNRNTLRVGIRRAGRARERERTRERYVRAWKVGRSAWSSVVARTQFYPQELTPLLSVKLINSTATSHPGRDWLRNMSLELQLSKCRWALLLSCMRRLFAFSACETQKHEIFFSLLIKSLGFA